MPRLNAELSVAMGNNSNKPLSHDTNLLFWDSNAPTAALVGQSIVGSKIRWLTETNLVFESCQSGTCRIYTYDTRTGVCAEVSAAGADELYAGGGVWAKYLTGTGYVDSEGRTNATYGVAGVDDDGTVLIILDAADRAGLGYLDVDAASTSNVEVICYDVLDRIPSASIREGVVVFHAGGVLRRYDISTEQFSHTNAPILLGSYDKTWVVGQQTLGLGQVVFQFEDSVGWRLGSASDNHAPDIRISKDEKTLTVVSSKYEDENPYDAVKYSFDIVTAGIHRRQYNLYTISNGPPPTVFPTTTPPDTGADVIASDVITIREYSANNSGRGYAQVISSEEWFGVLGGKDIRGSWQYGVTAVVAATNATGESQVTVKDSDNNTYQSGRTSHGNSSVFIRPATTSTNATPLWEVTWVANSTTFSRVTLDTSLVNTTAIANTTLTIGDAGILDVASNNTPIAAEDNEAVWHGYVRLQYPLTRGDWTVGKDVTPSCPSTVERLVAWNNDTAEAYVVWNANTTQGSITAPAHFALELTSTEDTTAAVVAGRRITLIREHQWQPLSVQDLRLGKTPGLFKG